MLTIRQEAARRRRKQEFWRAAFWGCVGGYLAVIGYTFLRVYWHTLAAGLYLGGWLR